jgi:hypothetical protein
MSRGTFDEFDQLVAKDVTEEYPQSGERFRGRSRLRAMLESFRETAADIHPDVDQVSGGTDEWVLTPGYTVVRVDGGGNEFTITGTVTYPNGATWHLVQLVRIEGGKVAHLTTYFAEPFEAPDWRAPFRDEGP